MSSPMDRRLAVSALLVLAIGLGGGEALAQGEPAPEPSPGPATQVWLNFTPGWSKGPRWYLELDVEPKWQVSGGEKWRNLDLTPLVEHYPADWVDLLAEAPIGNTRQKDGLDTFELSLRLGAKFHLFGKAARHRGSIPVLRHERLPLTRVGIATLVRLEHRSFFYSDDTPDKHSWRARLRLEGRLALNHARLAQDRTLYAIGDVEYFQPLGEGVEERYVNKLRVRLGLGYRPSSRTRLEAIYVRDWNRDSAGAYAVEDTQAVDLRWRLFF